MPFLANRIAELQGDPRYNVSSDPLIAMSKLYFDTTNVESGPYAMRAIQEIADLSRIVYGDDFPMMTEAHLTQERTGLDKYNGFNPPQKDRIYRENLLELFQRFRHDDHSTNSSKKSWPK